MPSRAACNCSSSKSSPASMVATAYPNISARMSPARASWLAQAMALARASSMSLAIWQTFGKLHELVTVRELLRRLFGLEPPMLVFDARCVKNVPIVNGVVLLHKDAVLVKSSPIVNFKNRDHASPRLDRLGLPENTPVR